jgi:hydrogenase maturation factor
MLRELLASIPAPGPSVILGAAVGEDAAVIDTGGPELLVAKTDPITFAAEDSGRYLLAVNSNDLATTGAEPRWLLVTVLLPEGIDRAGVYRIFASVREACAAAAVALVGASPASRPTDPRSGRPTPIRRRAPFTRLLISPSV